MKIITWNINSVKARLSHLLQFLKNESPDIVLLQELKCMNEAFPAAEVEELGYNIALHGQKTYNGVAILSKFPLEDVHRGLAGEDEDLQARYIEAVVSLKGSALRVASVYVPNGQEVGSEKYEYKLRFFKRLFNHLQFTVRADEGFIIGGDFNVAPDTIDVHDPKRWEGKILFSEPERAALRTLINAGLYDAYRTMHPQEQEFTWWDYRTAAWEHNLGLRIDHFLLNAPAMDALQSCDVMKAYRDLEKPSDHAPLRCILNIA